MAGVSNSMSELSWEQSVNFVDDWEQASMQAEIKAATLPLSAKGHM